MGVISVCGLYVVIIYSRYINILTMYCVYVNVLYEHLCIKLYVYIHIYVGLCNIIMCLWHIPTINYTNLITTPYNNIIFIYSVY